MFKSSQLGTAQAFAQYEEGAQPAPAGAKKQGEELAAHIQKVYADLFN